MTTDITDSQTKPESNIQRYEFTWNSGHLTIKIGLVYRPKYTHIYDHILVESLEPPRAKLPIGEYGFRSLVVQASDIETMEGPVAMIRLLLGHAAQSLEWQKHVAESRQGSLF